MEMEERDAWEMMRTPQLQRAARASKDCRNFTAAVATDLDRVLGGNKDEVIGPWAAPVPGSSSASCSFSS